MNGRKSLSLVSLRIYSLFKNQVHLRTCSFSNFLWPLAVSIPKVGCSLIAFLPSVVCSCWCLFVELSDTPLSRCGRLVLLHQLACARQRWLIGCWWTQTGTWRLPVALIDQGFRCPFRSNVPSFSPFIACLLSASCDLFYSLFLPYWFLHLVIFLLSLPSPSLASSS